MESTAAESRSSSNSLQQHTGQQPPQPRKKRPDDFKFGKILGEGSFSTVTLIFIKKKKIKLLVVCKNRKNFKICCAENIRKI